MSGSSEDPTGYKTAPDTPTDLVDSQLAEQLVRLRYATDGGGEGLYVLNFGDTVIGSASDCDLVINFKGVSRRHCVIERGAWGLRIRDLGSTNGTKVDGVLVESAMLGPGSRLRLGGVPLNVEIGFVSIRSAPKDRENPKQYGFRGLVGQSPAMVRLFEARERLARADVTLLITGETGAGKSALARSVHDASARRDAPFVVFDCSAVAPTLVESALFGHERGAFTGADSARTGALRAAGQGTLFLDEVTELSSELQPKLLRALEEREFTPLGGTVQEVKCRVIAASQHNIRDLVEKSRFRRDLYYRLAVVVANLPPLRERKEDIPLIVDQLFFSLDRSITPFAELPEFLRQRIVDYAWPGNIRELRNYVERLYVMAGDRPLSALSADEIGWPGDESDVASAQSTPQTAAHTEDDTAQLLAGMRRYLDMSFTGGKDELVAVYEKQYIRRILEATGYNVQEAARRAAMNRRYLHDLMVRHGLDKKTLMKEGIRTKR